MTPEQKARIEAAANELEAALTECGEDLTVTINQYDTEVIA